MIRLLLLVCLTPVFLLADTKPEIRELVRRALAGLNKEEKLLGDYGMVRRWQRTEYNADGSVRTKTSGVSRRELAGAYWVWRRSEQDGKPLTDAEKALQEENIRKYLAERQGMTDAAWERKQNANRKNNGSDEWIQEFPEALDYKVVGEEPVNGRAATILEASPRPGYSPRSMRSRIFEKMRGKLWIDKQDGELAKADAEMFDTVSIGFGVLGKVEKGTKFSMERRKVADFWAVSDQVMKFDARIMLVKSMKQEIRSQRMEFVHRSELLAKAAAPTPARAGR